MSTFSLFVVLIILLALFYLFFFFNDTATTEIYTLSLHDALPIFLQSAIQVGRPVAHDQRASFLVGGCLAKQEDRKSTRLNSSHVSISYAVFCLKKKNKSMWNIVLNTLDTDSFMYLLRSHTVRVND